jgi:hypothetical protein
MYIYVLVHSWLGANKDLSPVDSTKGMAI